MERKRPRPPPSNQSSVLGDRPAMYQCRRKTMNQRVHCLYEVDVVVLVVVGGRKRRMWNRRERQGESFGPTFHADSILFLWELFNFDFGKLNYLLIHGSNGGRGWLAGWLEYRPRRQWTGSERNLHFSRSIRWERILTICWGRMR